MTFKSGAEWNGNRNGRGEGKFQKAFREAIAQVEQKKGKSLLVHLVEQAFVDNAVLVAVGKKILPDLSEGEFIMPGRFVLICEDAAGKVTKVVAKNNGHQSAGQSIPSQESTK